MGGGARDICKLLNDSTFEEMSSLRADKDQPIERDDMCDSCTDWEDRWKIRVMLLS